MTQRVVVIGGGLAGLAAATALAERGLAVTLLESRPRLGGRASSIVDGSTGETIDNCQHVTMGCCTNFREFCRRLGIEHLFRTESQLTFIGPDGRSSPWSASPLPAPFHLTAAFLRLPYLTLTEKLAAGRGLRTLAGLQPDATTESFEAWLTLQHQPTRLWERFWDVVLVSALSESLDRIDVRYARKVFVDGFLSNRDAWRVTIPCVPLDDIYGGPILKWLEGRGATVRLQAGVQSLIEDGGRITGVSLRSGETVPGDQFVLAVPSDRVPSLLSDSLHSRPELAAIQPFETAPISSVHLWFDRPITDLGHAVLVGRTCQWLFQRSDLHRRAAASDAGSRGVYYQVVVSASRAFLEMPTSDAIRHVVAELTELFPAASEATLNHARIVTEHNAVFSPLPGIDAKRPPQQTPVPNLQLAGDWTRTGWPATMEGAVKSGSLAAENVLRNLKRPASIVAPELPVSRLSRWLFGLKDPA